MHSVQPDMPVAVLLEDGRPQYQWKDLASYYGVSAPETSQYKGYTYSTVFAKDVGRIVRKHQEIRIDYERVPQIREIENCEATFKKIYEISGNKPKLAVQTMELASQKFSILFKNFLLNPSKTYFPAIEKSRASVNIVPTSDGPQLHWFLCGSAKACIEENSSEGIEEFSPYRDYSGSAIIQMYENGKSPTVTINVDKVVSDSKSLV